MLIIFGFTMISNLVLSIIINTGHTDILFAKMPAEAGGQFQAQLDQLQTIGAGTWLVGLWERFSALLLHLGLSVLVWASVRKGGKWLWLFPAAILLHALVDTGTVLLHQSVGMVPLELIVMAESIAIAAMAFMVAKRIWPSEN